MGVIRDPEKLNEILKAVDEDIEKLNNQKITAFFDFLGLKEREDIPKKFPDGRPSLLFCLIVMCYRKSGRIKL